MTTAYRYDRWLLTGDVVVAPFAWADNTCDFCLEGLHTSCRHGGFWSDPGVDGGQGEAVRVLQAQGTLVKLPVGEDSTLLPSPARAYIEELIPDVLNGTIEPGRVFDRTVSLEDVPDSYRAMARREALKVLVRP